MSEKRVIQINVVRLGRSFSLETLSSRKIKECYTEVLQEMKYNLYKPNPISKK